MKVKVRPYRRKINGKIYKVKPYQRTNRKLGSRITYKEVGRFKVAQDNLGNFRGSKIVLDKKKSYSSSPDLRKLDTDFLLKGNVSYDKWIEKRKKLMKL